MQTVEACEFALLVIKADAGKCIHAIGVERDVPPSNDATVSMHYYLMSTTKHFRFSLAS